MVSSFPGVEFGKLYYRQLEIEKNIALKDNKGNYDVSLSLTSRAQSELRWWVENVDHSFNPESHGNPQVTLTTDASKLGWGAHVDSNATQGRWTIEESQLHINELELTTIEFAVRAFSSCLEGKHVKVESDNSTAVTYINSMGGTKSPRCNDIAYRIWSWCIIKNIWLTATHIAGVTNTRADEESRLFNDRTEWTLDKTIFAKIVEHWGLPDVDLFAARINTQLPNFVSWQPDPEAIFVDVITIDWSPFFIYAFPPFCQIHRCLQKLIQDQVFRGNIIVPLWPTQVWWPSFCELTAPPLVLPNHQDLSTLPHSKMLHPLRKKLTVVACQLSGNLSEAKAFQRHLVSSLWTPGDWEPESSMAPTCRDGLTFALNRKLIICNHL